MYQDPRPHCCLTGHTTNRHIYWARWALAARFDALFFCPYEKFKCNWKPVLDLRPRFYDKTGLRPASVLVLYFWSCMCIQHVPATLERGRNFFTKLLFDNKHACYNLRVSSVMQEDRSIVWHIKSHADFAHKNVDYCGTAWSSAFLLPTMYFSEVTSQMVCLIWSWS